MARKKGRRRRSGYAPTAETATKRANQSSGLYDRYIKEGIPLWKPSEGDNRVRILPPTWDDADHHGYDIWVHWGVGPDNQTYLSLSHHDKGPDPVEEAVEKAKRHGQGGEDWVKQAQAKKRILVWVVVRGEEKEGPRLWGCPVTVDKEIMIRSYDKETNEVLNITIPEGIDKKTKEDGGFDVEFRKEGTGLKTEYNGVQIARRSTPLSDDDDEMDSWLDFVEENPIPDCLVFYDYDHIDRVYNGVEEEEEEEAPKTRSERRKKAEEEDDDEEYEEEEEEDEPRGRRRGTKSRSDEIEDEEEELDEEEEEEEEEKPRQRRKRRSRVRR